jgi:hypothetical protein
MRKMTTFFKYENEARTGKKIRLYYCDGVIQNPTAWEELMRATDAKEDYRAEKFSYSAELRMRFSSQPQGRIR